MKKLIGIYTCTRCGEKIEIEHENLKKDKEQQVVLSHNCIIGRYEKLKETYPDLANNSFIKRKMKRK